MKEKTNTTDKKKNRNKTFSSELIKQMITLSTSGFGFIAALSWNNVIQELINSYIKKWIPLGGSIISLFIYAVLITILAVFITFQLSKLLENEENEEKS